MESRPPIKSENSNRRPLRSLQRQIDDIFEDFLSPWTGRNPWSESSGAELFAPACDCDETEHEFQLSFDLPGVKKEDVKVEVLNNQLVISGERKSETKEGKGRNYLHERYYGRFERRMSLPSNVKENAIEAEFENGVLSVRIPKLEDAKPRQIQIGEMKKLR